MSIETKTDEHDERGRQLHRWACLVCSVRGMWVRDPAQARRGMRLHLENRRHLERARRVRVRAPARRRRGEAVTIAEPIDNQVKLGQVGWCRSCSWRVYRLRVRDDGWGPWVHMATGDGECGGVAGYRQPSRISAPYPYGAEGVKP